MTACCWRLISPGTAVDLLVAAAGFVAPRGTGSMESMSTDRDMLMMSCLVNIVVAAAVSPAMPAAAAPTAVAAAAAPGPPWHGVSCTGGRTQRRHSQCWCWAWRNSRKTERLPIHRPGPRPPGSRPRARPSRGRTCCQQWPRRRGRRPPWRAGFGCKRIGCGKTTSARWLSRQGESTRPRESIDLLMQCIPPGRRCRELLGWRAGRRERPVFCTSPQWWDHRFLQSDWDRAGNVSNSGDAPGGLVYIPGWWGRSCRHHRRRGRSACRGELSLFLPSCVWEGGVREGEDGGYREEKGNYGDSKNYYN